MAKTTIFIATAHGIILDAAAMGVKENVTVAPHEPIEVPLDYGRHLIAERFAVAVDAPASAEKTSAKKASKPKAAVENASASNAAVDPNLTAEGDVAPPQSGTDDQTGADDQTAAAAPQA